MLPLDRSTIARARMPNAFTLVELLVVMAIIGVLTSVVSVFFYLRIVVMMYMRDDGTPAAFPPIPAIAAAALAVSAILIIYLGILPAQILSWAAASEIARF